MTKHHSIAKAIRPLLASQSELRHDVPYLRLTAIADDEFPNSLAMKKVLGIHGVFARSL